MVIGGSHPTESILGAAPFDPGNRDLGGVGAIYSRTFGRNRDVNGAAIPVVAISLASTVSHEIGHAVGLEHVFEDGRLLQDGSLDRSRIDNERFGLGQTYNARTRSITGRQDDLALLRANLRLRADSFAANDTAADAEVQVVQLNQPLTLQDRLDVAGDVDFFQINADAGEVLRVDVDAISIGSPIDLRLRVVDALGNEVRSVDNAIDPDSGLPSLDPSLEHTFADGGVFFIEITGEALTDAMATRPVSDYVVSASLTSEETEAAFDALPDELDPKDTDVTATTPLTFADATGDSVTVSVVGPGTATVTLVGDATGDADIARIVLRGGTAETQVRVIAASGTSGVGSVFFNDAAASSLTIGNAAAPIDLGAFTSLGAVGQVNVSGQIADLFAVTGSAGSITAGSIGMFGILRVGGSVTTIGVAGDVQGPIDVAGRVETVNIGGDLASLLSATEAGSITIGGSIDDGLDEESGDDEVQLEINGTSRVGVELTGAAGSLSIGADASGFISAAGGIGSVNVAGTLRASVDAPTDLTDSLRTGAASGLVETAGRSTLDFTLFGRGRADQSVALIGVAGGATYQLLDAGGGVLSSGLTDGSGISLAGYPAGDYTVVFTGTSDAAFVSAVNLQRRDGEPILAALDIDGNGRVSAFSDGLILFAALDGASAATLTDLRGPRSTRSGDEMLAYIDALADAVDVDGNGRLSAFSDALLAFAAIDGASAGTLGTLRGPRASRTGNVVADRIGGLMMSQPAASPEPTAELVSHRPAAGEPLTGPDIGGSSEPNAAGAACRASEDCVQVATLNTAATTTAGATTDVVVDYMTVDAGGAANGASSAGITIRLFFNPTEVELLRDSAVFAVQPFNTALESISPTQSRLDVRFTNSAVEFPGSFNTPLVRVPARLLAGVTGSSVSMQASGDEFFVQRIDNSPVSIGAVAPATPTVGLSVAPMTPVLEGGAANLVYTFTRSGPTDAALTVMFTTGGTAIAGTDYAAVTTMVAIPAGSPAATVTIDPIDNDFDQADRTVILTLVDGAAYDLAATSTVTGTIADDDDPVVINTPPTITAAVDATVTVGGAAAEQTVTLADAQTAPAALTLTAAIDNPAIAMVAVVGTGLTRTVRVTPVATGTATVTLTVTDAGGLTAQRTFNVTVNPAIVIPDTTPPTITTIGDLAVRVGQAIPAVGFSIADDRDAADALSVTVTSSNPAVVPTPTLSGTGRERTVSIVPVAGVSGNSTITLRVVDAAGNAAVRSFGVSISDSTITGRILTPPDVIRLHVIPGGGVPTAILTRAVLDTTLTVSRADGVGANGVQILNGSLAQIQGEGLGGMAADLINGSTYAIVFPATTDSVVYSIRSSAGFNAMSQFIDNNLLQPTDTNGDGQTSALDALLIINALNNDGGSGEPGLASRPGFFGDVNDDGQITAIDALRVINQLNARASVAGQSEVIATAGVQVDWRWSDIDTRVGADEPASEESIADVSGDSVRPLTNINESEEQFDEAFDWLSDVEAIADQATETDSTLTLLAADVG